MLNLQIDTVGELDLSVVERQIPFVIAKALTLTAKDAQEATRRHIRDTFVIRKQSGGFESSIVIRPATKVRPVAEVYTMASFAALQQTGGVRTPQRGRLAIPDYSDIRQVRREKPRRMSGTFEIRMQNGGSFLAQRRAGNFRVLFHLNQSARVDKRLNMIETVTQTVGNRFAFRFNQTAREL